MARSKHGLIVVGRADPQKPIAELLKSDIHAVEARAHSLIKDAGIELKPGRELQLADARERAIGHTDTVCWALTAIHHARGIRGALKLAAIEGEHTEARAISVAFQVWQFCGAAYLGQFTEAEQTLVKGIRFTPGPNEKRRDLLAKIIDKVLTELGRDAPADKVLSHIQADPDPAIQEVDDDQTIWWRDNKGREQKTTFKTFQNRVSERRKLVHK